MKRIAFLWIMMLTVCSSSAAAADVPSALKDKELCVVTSGGVRHALHMTVAQLLALMKKQNANMRSSWEKTNSNYFVLIVRGYDPMSGNYIRTGFGFALTKRDPNSAYLSAMTVDGVQVPNDEIVAFGIIMARKHDSDQEEPRHTE